MMDEFSDQRLLQYESYEDYLDSFITKEDLRNLPSVSVARRLAELGLRSNGETLSRDEFESRRKEMYEFVNPKRKLHILFSTGVFIADRFLHELATRERANRIGMLSTIIFLRHYTKSGQEISGYIDYQHSLRRSRTRQEGSVDWPAIFTLEKVLWPSPFDLGYYNWRTGESYSNNTDNYKVISDPFRGLIFYNRQDHRNIYADAFLTNPGSNTTKFTISTEKYPNAVLFDHIGRKKL